MGSQWVEDPSWGNIFTGMVNDFQGAPGKALSNIAQAEAIKDARIKRAREEEVYQQSQKLLGTVDASTAPAYVAPTPYTAVGPFTGDINDPAVTAGLPTADLQYTDPRAMAAAEARRARAIAGQKATLLKDPSQWAAQGAYGDVAAAGMPTDQKTRAEQQFATTGKWPTADESKLQQAHNFTIYDKDGSPTGRSYSTRDGRTTLDGRPVASLLRPGEVPLATGPASAEVKNPFETDAIALQNFTKLAAKAQTGPLTKDEIEQAHVLANKAFPESITTATDPTSKALVPVSTRPNLPTAGANRDLLTLIDAYNQQLHLPAEQRRPTGAARFIQPTPPAPATAADANAPPPPPAAAPPAFQSVSVGAPVTGGDPQGVVKRYMDQPVIDYLEKSKNGYSSVISAMPQDNKAADIAIVNGAAKVIDPPGVVRPAEAASYEKTQGALDQLNGMLAAIQGGARLTKTGRYQIWNMINEKVQRDVEEASKIREQHAQQLRDANINPDQYLPRVLQVVPVNPDIINTVRTPDFGDGGATTTAPPAATVPPQSTNPRVDQILRSQ
jgi:hypothetical protein